MSSWELGNLAYLVLLGAVLVFWFVAQNRNSPGKTMQQAIAWGLIFLGVIAAIGLWDDIRQTVRPRQAMLTEAGRIEVPRANDGHYYLTLGINGTPVEFMVDTGASQMVLTAGDARRSGIDTADLAYVGRAMTANGEVRTAPVRLDSIAIGALIDRDVQALVNQSEMKTSLMGMRYLQRFNRVEIRNGQMVLER